MSPTKHFFFFISQACTKLVGRHIAEHKETRVPGKPRDLIDCYLDELDKVCATQIKCILMRDKERWNQKIKTIPFLPPESWQWLVFPWKSTPAYDYGRSLGWDWHYIQHPAHWLSLPHELPRCTRCVVWLFFLFFFFVQVTCDALFCQLFSVMFSGLSLWLSVRAMPAGDRPGVGWQWSRQFRRQAQHALHAGILWDRFLWIGFFWYLMCSHGSE